MCVVYEPSPTSGIWLPAAALLTHQQHSWQVACCIASYSGSLLSLHNKLFEHLKIHKWEKNCIRDRWRPNFFFCNFVMERIQMTTSSNSQMAHGREMAHCSKAVCFLSVWLQGWLQGCLWRYHLCVSWDQRGHLRFIYSTVRRKKKHAIGMRTPWKAGSHQFPLPAESFRELTVNLRMFFKRLVVLLLPLNQKQWRKG